jgi:deoxyadenosine/deoxycytidine kinase
MDEIKNNIFYVLISGNTGVGKTTAAEYISKTLKVELLCDPFIENPFIKDSFTKANNKSFQSQLFFFKEFIKIHKAINVSKQSIIQERSIFETVNIFCKLFYRNGSFSKDELSVFIDLFNEIKDWIKMPDLIIYIKSDIDTNLERIVNRNRSFESGFNAELLSIQDSLYTDWIVEMKTQNIEIIELDNTKIGIEEFEIKSLDTLKQWLLNKYKQLDNK